MSTTATAASPTMRFTVIYPWNDTGTAAGVSWLMGSPDVEAAVDTAAHGSDRHAEGLADLLVGEADHVAKHHDGAEVLGQRPQGVLDVVGQHRGGQRLICGSARREHPVGVLGQKVLGPALAA